MAPVQQSPNTTAAMSPPPPASAVSPVLNLAVRIVTFICLLISVILLTTNTVWVTVLVANGFTSTTDHVDVKVKFNDFYAYRYLLAATVIGLAYALLQTAFAIFLISTGNRLGGNGMLLFDFYADKVIAFALATGAAASFGMTQDLKNFIVLTSNKFLNTANAAASLCLIGFSFSAVSSVFSSFALPKKRF